VAYRANAPRDRVDEHAADEGSEDRGERRRAGPNAERAALLFAVEVRGDDGEGPRHQQRSRGALQDPEHDQQHDARSEPAQERGDAEPDQADPEDPAAAEVVDHGAAKDQQGREG
jgi:hypothetical protein